MRTILHCDMNNFYASVECMLDPGLKSFPVAVCGRAEERHGIVLAKNYAAKACGVSTGEPIWQAKQKCPKLVTVDPHYREYMKYSRLAREIYMDYTDQVEAFGMDENWLDVSGSKIFGDGPEIADIIRNRVKNELGLTISVGVSFNKVFAKLGSDMKKPDAVTCITEDNFRSLIWGLPAAELLGVGPSTAKSLKRIGINTIGELAACPDSALEYKYGISGIRLKEYANGLDRTIVTRQDFEYPIKSVGNGITFLADLTEPDEVFPMLFALSDKVAGRLREAKKRARGISLTVKCCDLSWKEWQARTEIPTSDASDLANAAMKLFSANYPWVKPIRAMTVRAISLCADDVPRQLTIFSDDEERRAKRETIDAKTDALRGKYGWGIIKNAVAMNLAKLPCIDEDVEIAMPSGVPV